MTSGPREELIRAWNELNQEREKRRAPKGKFYARITMYLTVNYFDRLPVDFEHECVVSTDTADNLQTAVRQGLDQMADSESIHGEIEKALKNQKEGESYDSEESDGA